MTPTETQAVELWARGLFPFQRAWVAERARFALWIKSRQIGGSHATAAACVASALLLARPQVILSASQDLSDEVLAKVRGHIQVLTELGFDRASHTIVDNASELAWANGGRIIALPANPRTARSYSGDIWLDEFAYHADPELIRDAAFPIATRGDWKVRVLSTPNGASGLFHEWATAPHHGWAMHTTTIDDARAQGLSVDMDALWALTGGDERLFDQWFRCAFLDAELQYLQTSIVDAAMGQHRVPDLSRASIHAGLDVGREHDITALSIVAELDGIVTTLGMMTCKRTDFRAQRKMIDQARAAYSWDTLHVDATGLGSQLAEELAQDYGRREVVCVTFSSSSKADMATRVYAWLASARLRIQADAHGKELRADMLALRRVVTASGGVSYESPRTAHGHGDRFWALALALTGAGKPPAIRGMTRTPIAAVA